MKPKKGPVLSPTHCSPSNSCLWMPSIVTARAQDQAQEARRAAGARAKQSAEGELLAPE